ncbi:MAG: hypothetical protein AUK03_01480 [Anaerolineae bacterium CG2_30_64_16]|nr:MAG: hypothetical protein AUK03_01480 [Anaerolineae bacterium CG2_30_64_16]
MSFLPSDKRSAVLLQQVEEPVAPQYGAGELIPSPLPYVYGYTTPFIAPPAILAVAHQAVRDYRTQYYREPDSEGRPYPWRQVNARHTGLPALLRGFLDAPLPAPGDADVANAWLLRSPLTEALFGLNPDVAHARLKLIEASPVTTAWAKQQTTRAADPIASLTHVLYQQHHGEWPVFGGQVVVHLAVGDRRAAVTSSYFPLTDQSFFLQVDEAQAIALAQKALAQFARLHVTTVLHGPAGQELREVPADSMDPAEWPTAIVPYAGSKLAIFPFAGAYHLAYQVELLQPDFGTAWRVFVDAESGAILGRPRNTARQAHYFATAAEALAGAPQGTIALAGNPCADFMEVGIYHDNDPAHDSAPNWASNLLAGPDFEAINVAVHAGRLYDHFVAMLDPATASKLTAYRHAGALISPALHARIARPAVQFDVSFSPAAGLARKLITFQTDNRNGLIAGDQKVYHPAHDPEIIYHEVAHALMWLLKADQPNLFDEGIDSLPFVNALIEGYANYLARSYAARADPASPLWARAAEREVDVTAPGGGWGDIWALSRPRQDAGADLLPAPNLYPHLETTGLDMYKVGMVWARVLWDLRVILGADLVDRLALDAYNHLHGWTANFELAAEGVLDAAAKLGVFGLEQVGPSLLARRGIVAGQGVQALAQGAGMVLAGSNAGLMRSLDDGATWTDWDDAVGGGKLTNVVALAADGATFYAATETGVYQRESAAPAWTVLGAWPITETPFSLIAVQEVRYVGTASGVLRHDAAADWRSFGTPAPAWPGLGLAVGPALGTDVLYCASFDALRFCGVSIARWQTKWMASLAGVPVATCVTAESESAYLGTINAGIWQWEVASGQWTPVAGPVDLADGAVLALTLEDDRMLAGCTSGLFEGTRAANGAWNWARFSAGLPIGARVTRILPIGPVVLASTATHGLWRWDGAQWRETAASARLAGRVVASGLVAGTAFGPFNLDPGTRRVHLFWQPVAASVELTAELPVRVFEVGLEVKESLPVHGRYELPAGTVVVSVENGRAVPAAYSLHVA